MRRMVNKMVEARSTKIPKAGVPKEAKVPAATPGHAAKRGADSRATRKPRKQRRAEARRKKREARKREKGKKDE